ncbi:hypothetical protein L7F22_023766 [Adiantum nelumboides]|nr:hypothetical protein [Adiantum nelumboides]
MALAATAVSWGLSRPLDSCTPSSSCSVSSSSSCSEGPLALFLECGDSRAFCHHSSSNNLLAGGLLFSNGTSGHRSWIRMTKIRYARRRRSSPCTAIAASVATKEAPSPSPASTVPKGVENLVIIGSGPAGYTAAIYAARANLKPVVFEGYQAGGVPGGQLMTTTEVENFPGFPEGIAGPDLMDRMRKQAERWGAELRTEDVEFVDVMNRPFTVKSSDYEVKCHSLIIATGATAKRLDLPREHEFWSRGISACAICDGASPLFKGQELAVVGGGDTAAEETLYLTKYACHVHLLVRRDQMRASRAMQDRVLDNANVTVHYSTQVVDIASNDKGQMTGVIVRDTNSSKERTINVKGLFYGIGHQPNSKLLRGQVDLDDAGYVVVRNGGAETSVHGVYAAGDLMAPISASYSQVTVTEEEIAEEP